MNPHMLKVLNVDDCLLEEISMNCMDYRILLLLLQKFNIILFVLYNLCILCIWFLGTNKDAV